MSVLKDIFANLPWTVLRPADYLIDDQPGYKDEEAFIKVAANEDETVIVAYNPTGDSVSLMLPSPEKVTKAEWIDPRNGLHMAASPEPGDRLI